MNYAMYDPASGRIIQAGVAQAGTEFRYEPYIEGDAGVLTHYVDLATLTIQEKLPSPVSISGSNLLNVPAYSKLRVSGVDYGEVSGLVELEFKFPGSYEVVIKSPQHLDFTGTVVIP